MYVGMYDVVCSFSPNPQIITLHLPSHFDKNSLGHSDLVEDTKSKEPLRTCGVGRKAFPRPGHPFFQHQPQRVGIHFEEERGTWVPLGGPPRGEKMCKNKVVSLEPIYDEIKEN